METKTVSKCSQFYNILSVLIYCINGIVNRPLSLSVLRVSLITYILCYTMVTYRIDWDDFPKEKKKVLSALLSNEQNDVLLLSSQVELVYRILGGCSLLPYPELL